jgi:hypothetical protein
MKRVRITGLGPLVDRATPFRARSEPTYIIQQDDGWHTIIAGNDLGSGDLIPMIESAVNRLVSGGWCEVKIEEEEI